MGSVRTREPAQQDGQRVQSPSAQLLTISLTQEAACSFLSLPCSAPESMSGLAYESRPSIVETITLLTCPRGGTLTVLSLTLCYLPDLRPLMNLPFLPVGMPLSSEEVTS